MMRRLYYLALGLLPALLAGTEAPTARPDTRPRPITQVAPEYPEMLKQQRVTGSANLRFVIDENGEVRDVVIDDATREEFGRAAATAVAQWKYSPATKAGRPCAVKAGIPVGFALSAADLAELDKQRSRENLPPGPPVLTVEELDEWPELKKETRPETPSVLVREGRMGQATMEFIVDEQGVPRDIHPLTTTHPECSDAATAAIGKWRFTTGRKAGRVVRTILEVTLSFFPENKKASGLRVRPGVRSGDGLDRLPVAQREAKPMRAMGTPPKPIKRGPPEYPEEMSARGQPGNIIVEFIIDAHGRVTHVKTLEGTNLFFAVMAERAVSQWQFQPATLAGQPVACRVRQPMEFNITQ